MNIIDTLNTYKNDCIADVQEFLASPETKKLAILCVKVCSIVACLSFFGHSVYLGFNFTAAFIQGASTGVSLTAYVLLSHLIHAATKKIFFKLFDKDLLSEASHNLVCAFSTYLLLGAVTGVPYAPLFFTLATLRLIADGPNGLISNRVGGWSIPPEVRDCFLRFS